MACFTLISLLRLCGFSAVKACRCPAPARVQQQQEVVRRGSWGKGGRGFPKSSVPVSLFPFGALGVNTSHSSSSGPLSFLPPRPPNNTRKRLRWEQAPFLFFFFSFKAALAFHQTTAVSINLFSSGRMNSGFVFSICVMDWSWELKWVENAL